MSTHDLERTLPDGTVKGHNIPMTRREASMAAAYCIRDNGIASKPEALRFAALLLAAPDGTPMVINGYTFRIIESHK